MFSAKKPEKVADAKEPVRPIETAGKAPVTSPPSPAPTLAAKPSPYAKGPIKMAPSIIGDDLTVTGNVISKGEVQIEGEVQGDIHCSSLVIGEKATITGGVVAEDVIIRGRVLGSVRAQRVSLQATSHVEGDVHHQSLAIEQGAFFEGKSRRSDNPMAGMRLEATPAKPASSIGTARETQRAAAPAATRAAE